MKRTQVFFLAFVVFFKIISGQWLETTIDIAPDSGTIALVWNSTNNRLYCANYATNNLTVIDCNTNQIITRIPTGEGPTALAYNRINNRVYCANRNSNNITVIDCTNNEVETIIPVVGTWPGALLWNPLNNKVYCAVNWGDNITVINGATNRTDTTIYAGNWPQFFALNTTNNTIYCAVEETDQVVAINCANQHIIANINVGDSPKEVIWNSVSNKVYSTNRIANSVTIINAATNQVITTIPVGNGPQFLAYNSTNNKVYCSNNLTNTISVIDGYDDHVDTTLNMVYSTTWNLLWNRLNNKLYCCLFWPSTVRVTNCQSNVIVASIIVGAGPKPLAWDSIDNRVYVGCYDGRKVSVLCDEMDLAEEPVNFINDNEVNNVLFCPNPFSVYTKIHFSSCKNADFETNLHIYDITGKLVRIFFLTPGRDIDIIWDGKNNYGKTLCPGVYFCQKGKSPILNKVLISR
jgi:YVTN family beta-propeller protein